MSLSTVPARSEHDTPPVRVVVHDPSATAGFARLADVPADELQRRTLFREHPDAARFAAQHAALVTALRDGGAEVIRLGEVVGAADVWPLAETNPNQVYTRDSVVTLPWLPGRFLAGRMRAPVRRDEVAVMSAALERLGLQRLAAMDGDAFVEGGDVIPLVRGGRRTLLVGHGPRTTTAGVDALCALLLGEVVDEVIAVELPPWRMNLDGALVPVAGDVVLAHPDSLVGGVLRDGRGERRADVLDLLASDGTEIVEVTRDESTLLQACNCVCLGPRRLVCYDLAPRVVGELRRRGIAATAIPGDELVKGTGGPRCMTRPLYA